MRKIALSAAALAATATMSMANTAEVTKVEETSALDSVLERIHAKGDLRLRHEIIEREDKEDKYRERYRFRYFLDVDIMDDLLLETATSSGKGNPTSGNVTFRDDENIFTYFPGTLKIDILDLKYSFGDSWLRAGRSKHKIYRPIKTQLVWDNDIRLEGVNYGYKDGTHFVRLGANRINREEGYQDGDDINMFIAQYVNTMKFDDAKVNLGAAYYLYDGVKGTTYPYGSFKSNSHETVDGVDVYSEDYGIAEGFVEYQNKDLIMGMPFKAAAIVAYNTLAAKSNLAYDFSTELKVHKKFKAAATYRKIAKDAVFGAHNDSDFSGGGTNSKGYYVKGKYKFAKNVDIGAWFNWSRIGENEKDYHRTQLDVILKF